MPHVHTIQINPDRYNAPMNVNVVPWVLACAGAVWFGLLAFRTGRNWVGAAFTGGLFALVVTTFVFGLGSAMSTPFSDSQRAANHLVWTVISVFLVAVVAGAFQLSFWRHPLPPLPAADEAKATPGRTESLPPPPATRADEKSGKPGSK